MRNNFTVEGKAGRNAQRDPFLSEVPWMLPDFILIILAFQSILLMRRRLFLPLFVCLLVKQDYAKITRLIVTELGGFGVNLL